MGMHLSDEGAGDGATQDSRVFAQVIGNGAYIGCLMATSREVLLLLFLSLLFPCILP